MTEAAKLAKVSRRTIQRYTKSGKLSVTKDRQGNPLVDTAELARVFGQLVTPPKEKMSQPVATDKELLLQLQEQIKLLTNKVEEQSVEIQNLGNRLTHSESPAPQVPKAQTRAKPKRKSIAVQRVEAAAKLAELRARHAKDRLPMDAPIEILRGLMLERRNEISDAEQLIEDLRK
jgi:hypothetical protein